MILRGRGVEQALVRGLLDDARAGMSGVLILRGDAGIGKTAVLDQAVASASGMRVTRVAGVEAEQELAFAALHRVLLPFLGVRAHLPDPQRAALETAFGMAGGTAPDRFLVGLAALTLLAESARERPLLMVCDDAQWLDRESLDVLAFVGRRLHADGIVALFALRDDVAAPPTLTGLPEFRLAQLPESDALALLMDHAGDGIDQVVAERILDEAAGNPLALRELSRGPALVDQGFGAPRAIGRRLESRFLRRVHDMPAPTQTVLLTAAADATGDRHLVRRAVQHLLGADHEDIAEAFEQAEREELLTSHPVSGTSQFRHPLIRSAVYSGATRAERRSVHAALASVTDAHAEPERHAWHSAAAADGPDELVASVLHRCAERARNSGGYLAQAAFLQRASDLTDDPVRRTTRLLEACAAALTAGAPHRAEELLQLMPTPGPGAAFLGAHADRLRGLARLMLGRDGSVRLLLDAALVLLRHESEAGRDALLEAFDAAMVVPRTGPAASALRVAGAALTTSPRLTDASDVDASVPDLLLAGHARLVAVGHQQAAPHLRAALAAMRLPGAEESGAVRWSLLGMIAAIEMWDIDALGECGGRYADAARRHGALRMLQISAHANATSEVFRGNLAVAESHFAEFKDIADATGADPRFSHPTDVMLHAWRGDEAATMSAVRAQRELYPELPGGIQVQLARAATVVLELGRRRYPQAQAAAQDVLDDPPPHCGGLSLPGLVEAAIRNDDPDVARRALHHLAERATASGTPWALGLLARSRALLAPDTEAEDLFQEAAVLLEPTPLRTERAHTDLLYGEWLRRQRRKHDARIRLRGAHEQFTSMGAAAFAERARLELRATGEQARRRRAGADHQLTPQESRIVRMAAQGATNQEIATSLFISASTVEYHLAKVFRKLGVTSRRQLSAVLER
ncbi:LuxR C-terminal-related transcriptional regulator [Streptomyces goshikiensis]|uniref:helix-turn-helix transcriptional regulator n=1 Tax=Streptomyces goshikiensis TaxID=1942 RepID=UPI0036651F0D